jgi:hypothetical protein
MRTFFGGRRRHLSDWKSAVTSRRPAVGGNTQMVNDSTLMSVGGTGMVGGSTLTVDGDTYSPDT